MNIIDHAKQLIFSKDLSKLHYEKIDYTYTEHKPIKIPAQPQRSKNHNFSNKQLKFPSRPSLNLPQKKAQALHFFANHELQAIEMMAAGILIFPSQNKIDHKLKIGIMNTIQDEKKHFHLYVKRMNDLGFEFGDFPINNFFWKQMQKIRSPSQFYAFIALTLEAANLDFAKYYREVFQSLGDTETAGILNTVYQDEITHVALGRTWLDLWREEKTLWEYYLENLPDLITPARAKGNIFDMDGRIRAGLDKNFINKIITYRDDFSITDRKNWKKFST